MIFLGSKLKTVEGIVFPETLVGKEIDVFCMDEENKLTVSTAKNFKFNDSPIQGVLVKTTRGDIVLTPDNLVYTFDRGAVYPEKLSPGDKLIGLNRKMHGEQKVYIGLNIEKAYRPEHRFIAGFYYDIKDKDVHHVDGDHMNNTKSNLEPLDHHVHSRLTMFDHPDWSPRGIDGKFTQKPERKKKNTFKLTGGNPPGIKLKVISVQDFGRDQVGFYSFEVEKYHNCVVNGILIGTD